MAAPVAQAPATHISPPTTRGTLVILAEPCIGVAAYSATHSYPVRVSVRDGRGVVFQATVAGGRQRRVLLPAGSYAVSARYDGTVQAMVTAGSETSAHLINNCK